MTGVQTCALPICFPVTISAASLYQLNPLLSSSFYLDLGRTYTITIGGGGTGGTYTTDLNPTSGSQTTLASVYAPGGGGGGSVKQTGNAGVKAGLGYGSGGGGTYASFTINAQLGANSGSIGSSKKGGDGVFVEV